MGQSPSCGLTGPMHDFFEAVGAGDVREVESLLRADAGLLHRTTLCDRLSPLHIAAANGRLEVLSLLLDQYEHCDLFNRHKQTPLMLAAMRGNTSCVEKLLQAGANILVFDSVNGRTCLHYAAYYGHKDCLQAIISAARSNTVADSWGFARFVNVRDDNGSMPLHLAARQGQAECVHVLLDSGALVNALTCGYSYPGSTPLHLAARAGCLDCVRELLSWGADRKHIDAVGRIPYSVALRRKHRECAALLNPTSAEPLVWPSLLKFISELNPDAKALLEAALVEANKERERKLLKGKAYLLPPPVQFDCGMNDDSSEVSDAELCCICFEQACTIEVQNCGHQMCAHCTLALCCHTKPSPASASSLAPVCPFCRSDIAKLMIVKTKSEEESDMDSFLKHTKSRTHSCSEGSSSFKGSSDNVAFGQITNEDLESAADTSVLIIKL